MNPDPAAAQPRIHDKSGYHKPGNSLYLTFAMYAM